MDVQYYYERGKEIAPMLNRVLPEGLKITNAITLYGKLPSLTSAINLAKYEIRLSRIFDRTYLKRQIEEFLQREEIVVDRAKDAQIQKINIRSYVESIEIDNQPGKLLLSLIHDQGKTARVQEILQQLLPFTNDEVALCKVHREALLIQTEDKVITPFDM
jgi:radical SAM-linked protein